MTMRRQPAPIFVRRMPCVLAFAAVLAASGCATGMSIDDAVPVSANQGEAGTPQQAQAAAQPAFSTPSDYPNLNVTPVPAASQITPAEREADTAQLRATRAAVQGQGRDSRLTSSAELRRIGDRHANDALKQIEGD